MTPTEIHRKAREVERERGVTHAEALSILGRHGAAVAQRSRLRREMGRRLNAGVAAQRRRFWWEDAE